MREFLLFMSIMLSVLIGGYAALYVTFGDGEFRWKDVYPFLILLVLLIIDVVYLWE